MYIDNELLEKSFFILIAIYFGIMIINSIREYIKENHRLPEITISSVMRSIKRSLRNILFALSLILILLVIPTIVIYIILKYIF